MKKKIFIKHTNTHNQYIHANFKLKLFVENCDFTLSHDFSLKLVCVYCCVFFPLINKTN